MMYGFNAKFSSWSEMTAEGVREFIAKLLKANLYQVLAIIGLAQVVLMPVIAIVMRPDRGDVGPGGGPHRPVVHVQFQLRLRQAERDGRLLGGRGHHLLGRGVLRGDGLVDPDAGWHIRLRLRGRQPAEPVGAVVAPLGRGTDGRWLRPVVPHDALQRRARVGVERRRRGRRVASLAASGEGPRTVDHLAPGRAPVRSAGGWPPEPQLLDDEQTCCQSAVHPVFLGLRLRDFMAFSSS